MRKHRVGLLVIPLAMLGALDGQASQGSTDKEDVIVDPVLHFAHGSIHATRINNDSQLAFKEIGCNVQVWVGILGGQKEDAMVTCFASKTKTGPGQPPVQLTCTSKDSRLIAIAANINVDSFVTFQVGTDKSPEDCSSIFVENSSKYWQVPHD